MDVFVAEDTLEGVRLDARIGGSPFNVAIGLARMQQSVCFVGAISRGRLGERLVQALDMEGVSLECVQRVSAPTTLGLIAVDAAGVPDYAFYSEGAADRQLGPAIFDTLPALTKAIHIGSYASVVQPIASFLEHLIELEHGQRVIAYDPNVRLNVEPDINSWRARLTWMLSRTHILKVSEEDLQRLFPDTPVAWLAAQWLAAGVAVVIVTKGESGASGWCAKGEIHVDAVAPGQLADTVGAGDTFQAALLTWFNEHQQLTIERLRQLPIEALAAAMRFAATAAAITCGRRGADLPHRGELPGD